MVDNGRKEGAPATVAYFVSHPIQYQAPLLRRIASEPGIALTAVFRTDQGARAYLDPGFGRIVQWDIPLFEGYNSMVIDSSGRKPGFFSPVGFRAIRLILSGGFDVVWVHGVSNFTNILAVIAAKLRGARVLLRDETTATSRRRSLKHRLLSVALWRTASLFVDRYLAIGSLNRDRYLELGIAADRIHMMPYAVDNRFFWAEGLESKQAAKRSLAVELDLDSTAPLLLFASKLQTRKRCSDVIRALGPLAAAGRRFSYVIAGEGEEYDKCQRLVAELEMAPQVRFLGFCHQEKLRALYKAADLFLLPSDSEPWGLVVNEAMSAGCAIGVTNEVGSAPDLIREGVNGFIVEPGNIGQLTAALDPLIADVGRLAQMGEASQAIIATWDFEADVDGLLAAIRS